MAIPFISRYRKEATGSLNNGIKIFYFIFKLFFCEFIFFKNKIVCCIVSRDIGILAIQLHSKTGDKDVNIKKVEYFVEKNAKKGLDLVVMPEFFSTGIDRKSFVENPEDTLGGETISKISEIAKKFKTNIVAGSVIEKDNGKLYNTSFVINRLGEIVCKYRKIHLYNYLGGTEGQNITAGDKEIVADLDFGKVGLGICFDIRYPLHFKKLAKMGADIFVLPTAWVVPRELYYDKEMMYVDNIHKINNSLSKITGGDLNVYVDVRANQEFVLGRLRQENRC